MDVIQASGVLEMTDLLSSTATKIRRNCVVALFKVKCQPRVEGGELMCSNPAFSLSMLLQALKVLFKYLFLKDKYLLSNVYAQAEMLNGLLKPIRIHKMININYS